MRTLVSLLNIFTFVFSVLIFLKSSSLEICETLVALKWFFSDFSIWNSEILSLSGSVIAAYIFFFINNFIPSLSTKKEYRTQISPIIEDILKDISDAFRMINDQSKERVKFPIENYSKFIKNSSAINFNDIYHGSVMSLPHDKYMVSPMSIRINVLHQLKSAENKIINLILSGNIKDYRLLKLARELEKTINFHSNSFDLISHGKSKEFSQGVETLKNIHVKSKELMLFYNKNIKQYGGYSDCDIWFNQSTKDYFHPS